MSSQQNFVEVYFELPNPQRFAEVNFLTADGFDSAIIGVSGSFMGEKTPIFRIVLIDKK